MARLLTYTAQSIWNLMKTTELNLKTQRLDKTAQPAAPSVYTRVACKQGRTYHWGLGGQGPPPIGLAPPPTFEALKKENIFIMIQ